MKMRPTKLYQQIADAIVDAIARGQYSVGTRLPGERELAETFSVSRPTVREAMKILAAKKLVRSKRGPKGGVFVAAPSLGTAAQTLFETTNWLVSLGVFGVTEIVETRRLLGSTCVRLAAERAQPRVLNSAQPYGCIRCGKPFGTVQAIEAMLGKLAGHAMFQGEALERLKMCSDCRVIDLYSAQNESKVTDL